MSGIHVFDADTAAEPLPGGNGRFSATVSDRWNRPQGGPNGGYLIAICLRALRGSMPFPDPIVLSAFFLRPGQSGPADVETELVRAGRTMATGEAKLIQDGKERVRIVATYSDLAGATGRTAVFNSPPALPPPGEGFDPMEGLSLEHATLAQQVEYRVPELPGFLRGSPSGRPSAELWARLQGGREPDLLSLALMVDAWAPVVLELGEAGSVTLELTLHLRGHPAPGWLACRAATRHVIDGLFEEDFEIWDSSGKLVAQARQLGRL
jgi:acyl-CoA thioesterase